jgi:hypothetical protein
MVHRWVACGAMLVVGFVTAAVGCGGKVLVDGDGGSGGTGGTGGDAQSSSSTFTSAVTTGPTSVTSSVTTGPTTTSVTASVTTGPTPFCDDTGNCGGDGSGGCIDCAIGDGGPCLPAYDTCLNADACLTYIECVQNCFDDECFQKCAEAYPDGAQLYQELVICAVCEACYNDCDGGNAGCP